MQKSLKGKTAIVTGASRGIGREIALKLGKLGATVVVNYARKGQMAEEVAKEIVNMGSSALAFKADVRKTGDIETLFEEAIQNFGKIDILVNNAGIAIYKKVEDLSEEEFDNIFATNVKGLFFACQQAARKMTEGARIINISPSGPALLPAFSLSAPRHPLSRHKGRRRGT